MKPNASGLCGSLLSRPTFTAALVAVVAFAARADVPATSVSLRGGTNSDGASQFSLEWNADSNKLYRIQERDGFESNSTWRTIDISTPRSSRGVFKVAPDKMEAGAEGIRRVRSFYRVQVPSPEIFRVEPAFLSTNGGTIYVIGQELDTNGVLRVGGTDYPPTIIEPGSLYAITIPPLPEGDYYGEWLASGISSGGSYKLFSVTGQPTPVGEAKNDRVQEPPDDLPASPMTASLLMPALMKAKEKANRTKCGNNLRVSPGNGELVSSEHDLCVEGRGLDFCWVRTYRSRSGTDTPVGQNWDHSYNIRVSMASLGNKLVMFGGNSQSRTYLANSNGVFTANECFEEGVFSNGVFILTFPDNGKWIFTPTNDPVAPGMISRVEDRHGNAVRFNYDSSGRLATIVDTLDRTFVITYYPSSTRVLSVRDFSGRQVVYSYYNSGEAGGSPGDLKTVRSPLVVGTPTGNDFPNGKITTYTYTSGFADDRLNHKLTSIRDPKNQQWLNVEYGTDPADASYCRVRATACGANPPQILRYYPVTPSPSNSFAVMQTIINDPNGNVSVGWFDSMNRNIIHRDLAARAVPGTPLSEATLPTTKLRDSDPDYWETRTKWNLDSMMTEQCTSSGSMLEWAQTVWNKQCVEKSFQFVYQRDVDPNCPVRHRGDLIVARELACCGDLDGDGIPPSLVTRYEYDPRFGSPARFAAGPRQSTSLDGTYSHGKVVPTRNNVAIKTKGTGADKNRIVPVRSQVAINVKGTGADKNRVAGGDNPLYDPKGLSGENALYSGSHFIRKITCPDGATDSADYNALGDCVRIAHEGRLLDGSDSPVNNFEFNSFGQLTAVVNPADANGYLRRDEFVYFDTGAQNGYCRTATVDAQGPTPLVTSYDYDSRGNLTMCVDPRGQTNRWIYNQLDHCVRQVAPPVCAPCPLQFTDYMYDANGMCVRVERASFDASGTPDAVKPTWTTLYTYDQLNRCTLAAHELTHTVQQATGTVESRYGTNRYVYDGLNNVIERHTPEDVNGNQPGNYVAFQYDTRNFLWKQVSGPFTTQVSTDVYDYDSNGNCVRIQKGIESSDAQSTSFVYEEYQRLKECIDALGARTRVTYDSRSRVSSIQMDGPLISGGGAPSVRLAQTRYEYDGMGRITHLTKSFFDPATQAPILDGASVITYRYAPNGQFISMTDDNGNRTSYSYDTIGRCVAITDAKQNSVTCIYDPNGNVVSITQNDRADAGGTIQTFQSFYQFDALDRCVLAYDNVGNTNRYAYDSQDNLTLHTDPRGNDVRRIFDGLGRCVETACFTGSSSAGITINTTHVEYDDNSRVRTFTDGNTNSTHYSYDALNRCVSTMYADGTSVDLIWSPRSNLMRRTDQNGTITDYTYDTLDRCIQKDITPAPGVSTSTRRELWRYDGVSHPVSAANDEGPYLEFSYDSLGNCVRRLQDGYVTRNTFDGVGNCTSVEYPSGLKVAYVYDALNQVTGMHRCEGCGNPWLGDISATFGYEGNRLARIARTNGINTRIFVDGDSKSPNAPGDFGWQQVSQINHQKPNGGTVIDRRTAAYDRAQNKIARSQIAPFVSGSPMTTNTWTYDALSQARMAIKTKGTGAQIYEYELDANGNRITTSSNGVTSAYTMDATWPAPADFQMDQYTTTPFGACVYDRNGNLISQPGPAGSTDYSYDYANRLVSVTRNVGGAVIPVVSFRYDAFGNRTARITYSTGVPVITTYVKGEVCDDGNSDIEEYQDGVLLRTFSFPHALEVSGRITTSPGGLTTYLMCDELGTALALTDDKGVVLERYDYDDFGYPHFLTSDGLEMTDPKTGAPLTESAFGNRYLFHGMEWHGDVGLYSSKDYATDPYVETTMRLYNPQIGRSINAQGQGCTGNNPWSAKTRTKETHRLNFSSRAHGDPIHGIDVKLGMVARSSGDPIHGVDVKLGMVARASGDPVHGVDVKLGLMARGGHGGGGCGGSSISIDEPGVHLAVMFNPKEYTITKSVPWKYVKEEGGRHTPFHNKYRPQFYARSIGEVCDDGNEAFYFEHSVQTAREAGSGLATGCRSGSIYAMYSTQKGLRTREAGSGMATGRRYNLFEAWPCRWEAPEMSASGTPFHWVLEVRVDRIEMK